MSKLTLKIFLAVGLSILFSLGGIAIAADEVTVGKLSEVSMKADDTPDITFLSGEKSKSLKITPIPTTEPVPLI